MPTEILPHDPLVRHHAWSDDPARDRAVRLAEDGVERRKTLEECIAGVFTAKPREIGKELVERLQRFTEKMLSGEIEMPMGKPSIIPKTASGSSAAEHENKGESMSGLRTERVTLEITHDDDCTPESVAEWVDSMLTCKGSSVRVVPDAEIFPERSYFPTFTIQDVTKIKSECDKSVEFWTEAHTKMIGERNAAQAERDALGARVAELEVTVKESLTVAAPAAEPVAWGVEINGHTQACYFTKYWADRLAEEENGTVVPICFSPPQPRGWLTGEEVWALRVAADNIPGMEDADGEPLDELEIVFRKLLARNSPPEVVLPASVHKDILAALAAAGVKVKSQS